MGIVKNTIHSKKENKMFKTIINTIRMAQIFKTLEKEHNHQCIEVEVKNVVDYLIITNLSNKEIVSEILEAEAA